MALISTLNGNRDFNYGDDPDGGGGGGGNTTLNPSAPEAVGRYKDIIEKVAKQTGVDPNLIAAMIWAESRGNPKEASDNPDPERGVDKGLMQVSNLRCKELGIGGTNLNSPEGQILAGATEIAHDLKESGGDLEAALKEYVGGDSIDPDYVTNVTGFLKQLTSGQGMSDEDPAGGGG
jgi:soluble lytic murein transglycosylase-like protein